MPASARQPRLSRPPNLWRTVSSHMSGTSKRNAPCELQIYMLFSSDNTDLRRISFQEGEYLSTTFRSHLLTFLPHIDVAVSILNSSVWRNPKLHRFRPRSRVCVMWPMFFGVLHRSRRLHSSTHLWMCCALNSLLWWHSRCLLPMLKIDIQRLVLSTTENLLFSPRATEHIYPLLQHSRKARYFLTCLCSQNRHQT